jgi:hypothetical protein
MSNRSISHALGIDEKTVRNDLERSTAENSAVEQNGHVSVIGLDGKERASTREDYCSPVVVRPIVKLDPVWFAREAMALIQELDAQEYGPDHLTAEHLRILSEWRDKTVEFSEIFEKRVEEEST